MTIRVILVVLPVVV